MTIRAADAAQHMKPKTIASLQALVRALTDSVTYHLEAADKVVKDDNVSKTFRMIASERKQICDNISGFITLADEQPAEEGTFMGTMRTIWTSFRAGLNSGDAKVVLIEAERAEDAIVNKFKSTIAEVASSPINDRLNAYFEKVKSGHDRILALRNAYQTK